MEERKATWYGLLLASQLRAFLADNCIPASTHDHVQTADATEQSWTPAEERALLRKLDMRVLAPCFAIYVLAYLDRGNIGSVKILQAKRPDSLELSLHMHGTEFNWVFFPADSL